MFYGADQFDTAVAEIVDPDESNVGNSITANRFRPKCRFLVLDLTTIPSWTSFFDEYDDLERIGLQFLRFFARDVSKPIKKDGREHIEYVPTQVFTEYVRHQVKTDDGRSVKGIKYKSSKDGKGCYVIFAEQRECLPSDSKSPHGRLQLLEAVPDSRKSVVL